MFARSSMFIVVLAAASFASLGAAAGGGDVLKLPTYPGGQAIPLHGKMETNDVPYEAAVFTTTDNIDTVMGYYRKALTERGLKVLENKMNSRVGYVGYWDWSSNTMRLATAYANSERTTMIVLSSMDPRPLLLGPAEVPSDLPAAEVSEKVVTTEIVDGLSKERTVRFGVPGLPPDLTRKQVEKSARELGWNLAPDAAPFGSSALVLTRGDETCVVRVDAETAEGGQSGSSVTMVVFGSTKPSNKEDGDESR